LEKDGEVEIPNLDLAVFDTIDDYPTDHCAVLAHIFQKITLFPCQTRPMLKPVAIKG